MLADRLVIVDDGRTVQEGDAATITAQPRTDYLARLVGLNLYRGTAEDHAVILADRFSLATADRLDGDVFVAFPPSAVALHPGARTAALATSAGHHHRHPAPRRQPAHPARRPCPGRRRHPPAAAHLHLIPGQPVWAAVKATETRAYPAAG